MTNTTRLPLPTKAAYGLGQISEGMKSTAFGLFTMFYFNQLLGLEPELAGLALMLALIFDAITDPLVGSISDRWRSRWGRRHPFLYLSILPLGGFFFLMFSPPEGLGQFGLFLWLTLFAMGTRGAITLFYVPHTALGAELTSDFGERTSVVQWRQVGALLGVLLTVALGFLVFFPDSASHRDPSLYPAFAVTLSLIMMAAILVSALGTHRRIPTLIAPRDDGKKITPMTLLRDSLEALSNRSFRWFFIGVVIIFMLVGVDSALGLYMNTYFWQLTGKNMFFLSIAYPIGALIGATITRWLHEKFDKLPVVIGGTACWAFFQILPPTLFLLGWFPTAGTDALLITLCVMRFFQGIGTVQALVSAGAMIADIADEHELKTGKRSEGVFFGALSFAGKCTTGLGNFVAGIGLGLIGWPMGKGITVADIPPDKIVALGIMYGPLLSAFTVVTLWCYSKYKLDRRQHEVILTALGRGSPAPVFTPPSEPPKDGAAPPLRAAAAGGD